MKSKLSRCLLLVALLAAALAGAAEFPTPRPQPERYAKTIAGFARQEPEKHGIVFIGSSSITRWQSLPEDFPDLPVLNRGLGGSVANDLIAFFDTIVLRHEPKLLVVYTGGNDINARLTVPEALADYTRFLELVHEKLSKTKVIVNSVKISPKRVAQIPQVLELNRRLEVWARERDWVRYLDTSSYLADAEGRPIRDYYVDDLLHLSPAGYKEWRLILEPVLREEWAKASAADPAPSSGEEHLRRWLKRFPDADYNRDGVLTAAEAWRYQGEGPQRARAAQAKKEQEIAEAVKAGQPSPIERRLAPDFADVRYGPHERNVLDLWLAKTDRPAPLVIFYHGGAWKIGDKRDIHDATIQACLAAGISVAAVNYRFTTTAPLPAPHLDSARALQFLRRRATEWHIDPKRVAAYGASAGAGISLWLAFHHDLAEPENSDPIARESTRLTCAGSINGQCTYDPFVIRKWIGEPAFQHTVFLAAYGVKTHADLSDPRLQPLFDEMAAIKHLSPDDAPVFESYTEPDTPLPPDAKRSQGMHHPIFGHKLKAAMDQAGVECVYVHVADIPDDPELEMVKFFHRQFDRP